MMKRHRILTCLILSLLFFSFGCASTKLTATWKDPAFNKADISNVVVIGVASNEGNRRIYEDEFVRQLQEKNIKATASYTLFALDKVKEGKDAVKAEITKKRGVDTVIVTNVLDKTSETKYYPPTVTYTRPHRSYYHGWYNYYHTGWSYYTTPGHTVSYDVVKLECNVYGLESEKLLYSGLSDTTITRGSKVKVDRVIKVLLKGILK